jgi:hypothetical protein
MTENGGDTAFESADGRTLFYTKALSSPLFALSLGGGPERQVLDQVTLRSFAVFEDGIYFVGPRDADGQYAVQFFNFSTGDARQLVRFGGRLQQGLAVSPDRKTILFSKSASAGADLMMIEGFR